MFANGPDLMLRNPDVSAGRWHRARARRALQLPTVLAALTAMGLVVVAVVDHDLHDRALYLVVGVLVLAACGLLGGWQAVRALTHHDHQPDKPCPLDRDRGAFFYRSQDFDAITAATVRSLLVKLHELHGTRAWIDPEVLRRAHELVWQALCWADRTSAVRALADELAATPTSDDMLGRLAAWTRRVMATLDDNLARVAVDLDGCLVLTRAWENQLQQRDLADRADRTLRALPTFTDLRGLHTATEALQRTTFTYITAARDVVGAGSFPWEPSGIGRTR